MKNILFVDDEPRILSGLERALRGQRSKWEMRFANSGAEALTRMDERPADVVITDFRMPVMDGAALLEQIRSRHPGTVRFILSGQFDNEAGLRALPETHQFLSKPCEPAVIVNNVEQICRLADAVASDQARRASAALTSLAPNPDVFAQLAAEVASPTATLESITQLVEQDIAITMKALQLANSAFFGVTQKADSISSAIGSLGFDLLRQLVLAQRVFEKPAAPSSFQRELQRHSQLGARLALEVFAPPALAYSASVAALLHDIGRLVLAHEMPDAYAKILAAAPSAAALNALERSELGSTHAAVGAYVAGIWGFPQAEVQAILHHHREHDGAALPDGLVDAEGKVHDLSLIVALADHFAGEPNPALDNTAFQPHWDQWTQRVQQLTA